jgi:hypothetical protein
VVDPRTATRKGGAWGETSFPPTKKIPCPSGRVGSTPTSGTVPALFCAGRIAAEGRLGRREARCGRSAHRDEKGGCVGGNIVSPHEENPVSLGTCGFDPHLRHRRSAAPLGGQVWPAGFARREARCGQFPATRRGRGVRGGKHRFPPRVVTPRLRGSGSRLRD